MEPASQRPIREVAERLAEVRDRFGGESISYYGGGGQGNHLPGIPRARVTLRELAKDPERCLVVIDVAMTETARLA